MKIFDEYLIYFIILIPILIGLLNISIFKKFIKFIKFTSLLTFIFCILSFFYLIYFSKDSYNPLFRVDSLSSLSVIWSCILGFLILIYSFGFIKKSIIEPGYYGYYLITIGCAIGALLSDDLLIFVIFWGLLALTLYLMVALSGENAKNSSKKAFILVGGSDIFLIIGLIICYYISDSRLMSDISITLTSGIAITAYIFILIGAFAKAGVIPFHSWIPDVADDALIPVTAFLPSSLDKLLGIYLLARFSLHIFILNNFFLNLLMIVGSITIVFAVMMALVQHNMKRLLGYHAVSQVGYMVLGIGTGTPIGVAGALFHMINNANYKSLLFLSSGAIDKNCGTTDLDKLNGLAKVMPYTFFVTLIAAFSISGIPPFNGFFSKWMIYKGIIESAKTTSINVWIFYLTAAMIGSVLTLASFIKLLHATFLGKLADKFKKIKEVNFYMLIPMIIISLICIFLGLFATNLIVPSFFNNIVGEIKNLTDISSNYVASILILGLIIGLIIYLLLGTKKYRYDDTYIGGNELTHRERITGTEFYNTISEVNIFKNTYDLAKKKYFDIYEVLKNLIFNFSSGLSSIHKGLLPTYLGWYIAGIIILLYIWFGGR